MRDLRWSGDLPREGAPLRGFEQRGLPPALVQRVVETLKATGCPSRPGSRWAAPVVIIDGPSGAGKTSLLAGLEQALRVAGLRTQVARADQWYPGWYGHASAGPTVERLLTGRVSPASCTAGTVQVLDPVGSSRPDEASSRVTSHRLGKQTMTLPGATRPGYLRWDWARGVADRATLLDASRPLVIEGCGTLTPRTRKLADLAIWVDTDGGHDERRRRAIARDGDTFAPWWKVWAAQDHAHYAAHRPDLLADVRVWT